MCGHEGILNSGVESARKSEKAMIEEMIAEDILTAKLNSEDGNILDTELENMLQDKYGTIIPAEDDKIHLLTYDYIDDTQFRDRYEITLDKIELLQIGTLAEVPNVDTTNSANPNENGGVNDSNNIFKGKVLFSVYEGVNLLGTIINGTIGNNFPTLGGKTVAIPSYGYSNVLVVMNTVTTESKVWTYETDKETRTISLLNKLTDSYHSFYIADSTYFILVGPNYTPATIAEIKLY